MRPKHWPSVFLGLALSATASIALTGRIVWLHRVELFEKPALWRNALRLTELRAREPENPALAPTFPQGMSELDTTLCRLVRLQDPTFRGGGDFRIYSMRSRAGRPVYAIRCEPFLSPYDSRDKDDREVVNFCNCTSGALLVLDPYGQLMGEPDYHWFWLDNKSRPDPYAVLLRRANEGDVVRVTQSRSDPACCRRCCLRARPALEFSIDEAGLVYHGMVTDDDLGLPLCPMPPSQNAVGVDELQLTKLLSSSRDGDAHRALNLLASCTADVAVASTAESLLSHPDPLVRARAVGILGSFRALAPLVKPLVFSKESRMQIAALEALCGRDTDGSTDEVFSKLSHDADPEVSLRARLSLLYSHDAETARCALLQLLADRIPLALWRSHFDLATGELARATLDWIEASEEWSSSVYSLECSLMSAYSADLLRPLVPRIALCAGRTGYLSGNLARVLVKADCDEGDAVISAAIAEAKLDEDYPGAPLRDILEALLERSTPLRGELGRSALFWLLHYSYEEIATYDGVFEAQLAAFALARAGSLEALQWLLDRLPPKEAHLADKLLFVQARWYEIRGYVVDCTEIARSLLPADTTFRFRDG